VTCPFCKLALFVVSRKAQASTTNVGLVFEGDCQRCGRRYEWREELVVVRGPTRQVEVVP
jgi:hypothetical protein